MDITSLLNKAAKLLRDNSSTILTAFGVSGTVTTAYLAVKAGYEASEIIHGEEENKPLNPNRKERFKERTRLTWKLYIPPVVSGTLTIGFIIGGVKIGTKRTAAAYSLLTVSEKAFTEYKEKVVEQFGVNKEQAVRDEIAQDRVKQTSQEVVILGSGNVLCFESHTGRYFNSDMETLRKAENRINAQLLRENEANLNDFYYLVGLPHTSYSSCTGWNSDKLLELRYTTVLSEDQRPCISFEYNYIKPL